MDGLGHVRGDDGQFYDAAAVDARVLRLGLDPAGAGARWGGDERGQRAENPIAGRMGATHSTFTDLCRSKSASWEEPGMGFRTFRIT